MENVERKEFVMLTGHLDDQPLPDLVRRLRAQGKSGRLQVEYGDGPGSFFFEGGQLVDAQLGRLRGVEALYAALSLEGGAFNFNPLVRPPERSIDRQSQQFVWDLIESERRQRLADIDAAARQFGPAPGAHALPRTAPLQLPPAAEFVAPLQQRLSAVEDAINHTARRFSRERLIYAVIIGFLAGLCITTTLSAIFVSPSSRQAPVAQAASAPNADPDRRQEAAGQTVRGATSQQPSNANQDSSQSAVLASEQQSQADEPSTAAVIATRKAESVSGAPDGYIVQVLVDVKDGRVTDARVWNPRPGAEGYEAVALRMARERRYPESFTGSERLKIMVKP